MGRSNPFFIVLPVNPEGSINDAPGVRALAECVLAGMDRDRASTEAIRFLEFVSAGKGIECGSKGQLLTWGYISNYGNAERTVEDLRPFWNGLWSLEDGPMSFEATLVSSQDEEGRPVVVQVGLDQEAYGDRQMVITTKRTELPFGIWNDF
ncbi:hypothetical protein [Methylobacterium sp. Leaf117]|uniref:hypothetical protein n=1 Tax=Methylobacterium sp. Leaf117 TaxID=1736260 RepID=UPI0006F82BCB|nr:hypothetical protein [Methylobacterium sp. Leaf117]KQP90786.1 hypothetical protein ASF57_23555 [Methylobacterium sp. Leaf117]